MPLPDIIKPTRQQLLIAVDALYVRAAKLRSLGSAGDVDALERVASYLEHVQAEQTRAELEALPKRKPCSECGELLMFDHTVCFSMSCLASRTDTAAVTNRLRRTELGGIVADMVEGEAPDPFRAFMDKAAGGSAPTCNTCGLPFYSRGGGTVCYGCRVAEHREPEADTGLAYDTSPLSNDDDDDDETCDDPSGESDDDDDDYTCECTETFDGLHEWSGEPGSKCIACGAVAP